MQITDTYTRWDGMNDTYKIRTYTTKYGHKAILTMGAQSKVVTAGHTTAIDALLVANRLVINYRDNAING